MVSTRPCSQRTVLISLLSLGQPVAITLTSIFMMGSSSVLDLISESLRSLMGCIVKLFTIMSSSAFGLSVGARESASAGEISFPGLSLRNRIAEHVLANFEAV